MPGPPLDFKKYNMPGSKDSLLAGYQTWREKIIYQAF
jgi:hypothetical protein